MMSYIIIVIAISYYAIAAFLKQSNINMDNKGKKWHSAVSILIAMIAIVLSYLVNICGFKG